MPVFHESGARAARGRVCAGVKNCQNPSSDESLPGFQSMEGSRSTVRLPLKTEVLLLFLLSHFPSPAAAASPGVAPAGMEESQELTGGGGSQAPCIPGPRTTPRVPFCLVDNLSQDTREAFVCPRQVLIFPLSPEGCRSLWCGSLEPFPQGLIPEGWSSTQCHLGTHRSPSWGLLLSPAT